MASAHSAGLIVYRTRDDGPEVLLVHPGGPFWATKDEHAWSIPKGEYDPAEDPLSAARREFEEELGRAAPPGVPIDLGDLRQPGGKVVRAWAVEGDFDADHVASNTFEMEWPPRSGETRRFPEVDRAAWFDPTTARSKLHKGQVPFVDRLLAALSDGAQRDRNRHP